MKKSQKLRVTVENLSFVCTLDGMDKSLLGIVGKLEKDGDQYGPVVGLVGDLCVTVTYADGTKPPTKQTIFGYDSEEFLQKQYK